MSRVIWKGALSFSLIHIPVNLQSASRNNALDLDLLDRRDFSPVGFQRVNKATGQVVEWADIVKGYKHEGDQYVVLTEEDFRLANVQASQTIEIQGFVSPGDIGPQYFETPYHLMPEPNGEKVYGLLRDALERSRTWAVGLIVLRTRQHICTISPSGTNLLLNTLRYEDELVEPAAQPTRKKKGSSSAARESRSASTSETAMALKLVEEMRLDWKPDAYHDTYREDLMRRVEQKVKAGEIHTLTAPGKEVSTRSATNVVDLTDLLRRSLEGRKGNTTRRSMRSPGKTVRSAPRRNVRTRS